MGACSTSCCGPDGNNVDTHQTVGETTHVSKSVSAQLEVTNSVYFCISSKNL